MLNDYSGSPKVLQIIVDGLCKKGYSVELLTSKSNGILDLLNIHSNYKKRSFPYHFSTNPLFTIISFSWAQICLFFMSFKYIRDKNIVFYINTIMPIGAAIAGKIMNKKVIYHYHENANSKGCIYKVLTWAMEHLADSIICVSNYQKSFLKRNHNIYTIKNCILPSFLGDYIPNFLNSYNKKKILMLCSLKKYKGIVEFVQLSQQLQDYRFDLIINENYNSIQYFFKKEGIICPQNLMVYSKQSDVSDFYKNSSLLVNLTDKHFFIETFGMTVLEGMSVGLPAIVPTVGGVAELIIDDFNGYKIDVDDLSHISDKIKQLLTDKDLYVKLARSAFDYSKNFNYENMLKKIIYVIQNT